MESERYKETEVNGRPDERSFDLFSFYIRYAGVPRRNETLLRPPLVKCPRGRHDEADPHDLLPAITFLTRCVLFSCSFRRLLAQPTFYSSLFHLANEISVKNLSCTPTTDKVAKNVGQTIFIAIVRFELRI